MMKIIKEKINRYNGIITFNELEHVWGESIESIRDELKEDMLQVEFPNNIILDIGWYPSFDIHGHFSISLVSDYNWDVLTYSGVARDFEELSIEIDNSLLKISS